MRPQVTNELGLSIQSAPSMICHHVHAQIYETFKEDSKLEKSYVITTFVNSKFIRLWVISL